MNRPTPSLVILAIVAFALALIFFGRQYLWPTHPAIAMGRAAVAGYSRPPNADAPDQDDAATVSGMIDAGRLRAKVDQPKSAAGPASLRVRRRRHDQPVVVTGRIFLAPLAEPWRHDDLQRRQPGHRNLTAIAGFDAN